MTQRLPDWENRLSETLAEWRVRRHRWNADCARYAGAVVIAQTGEDPIADLRGRYRTKREALKLLAEKPMIDRWDERFPRVPAALAQRGDIALIGEHSLGCVIGSEGQFFLPTGEMGLVPRAQWDLVWGVGRDG
ncbi:MAG: hypothetical protein AAF968_23255 [Pseudomonadota bacterium]